MRSDPAHYTLTAPSTLSDLLAILRDHPGRYTLLAGGTELMVALNTGRLPVKPLLSMHHLRELRFIEVSPDTITIGAGTTFTDIRRHAAVATDLPLLAQAASWTGSIANQNRGTLGGNIANASPAADTPPALLAYDATVTLLSAERGPRTLPYMSFHLGYKSTALAPDEIIYSVDVKRNWNGYVTYIRKVGTRNAQAISKVALAAVAYATTEKGTTTVTDVRIAAASLGDRPLRLAAAEQALLHRPLTLETIAAARHAVQAEARPIDDIRSTARYRAAVAGNLLGEFLHQI